MPRPFLSLGCVFRPIARLQVHLVQLRFPRARLRAIVIVPSHHRRQRHQDRLDPPARLQAEDRATVVEQIELDITATPKLLKCTLPIAVALILASMNDRQISVKESVAAVADEGEPGVEIPFEIVEKDAADATWLVAVS